ncbi:MAG: toprim domain-containing protein [Desulfarculus sp.]|nr:toprim domain-containing protein [Desulfarculus sp.]
MGWALDNLGQQRCRDIAASLFRVREELGRGDWLRGHCPLPGHEDKNPSFGYDFANDKFKCLTPSCVGHDGGDLIDLWALLQGLDKKAGFKAFKARFGSGGGAEGGPGRDHPSHGDTGATRAGGKGQGEKPKRPARPDEFIASETWNALPELDEAWLQKLVARRGWSREVIQSIGLRLWRHATTGEERVAIPVRDGLGRLLNIRKYLPGVGEGQKIKSWWEERSGEIVLFGQAQLFPPPRSWLADTLWLCEGEPDCLCALSLGLNAATVTGGAGNWKPAWTEVMAGRRVILAYDADQAGQKGARKIAQRIAGATAEVKIIAWPEYMLADGELPRKGGQDLTDFVVKHCRSLANLEALAQEAEIVEPVDQAEDDDRPEDGPNSPARFWLLSPGGRASFRPALLAREILDESDIITDRESGLTYRWNGRHYQRLNPADLQQVAIDKLGTHANMSRVNDAISQVVAKSTLAEGELLNCQPEYLCLPNGMLHLDSLSILPHDPAYRCTYIFPWEFDPHRPQDCPMWKQVLARAIDDRQVRAELQEFYGYCLWPDCRYEKALFLVGARGAGKSTLLDVLQWLVGQENCSAVDLPDLEDQFQRAALHDKAVNVFDEADTRYFSTKFFNTIVSGKSLQASFKFQTPFNFRPRCKLAFSANDFPRAVGNPDAFMDRLLVIRFQHTIRGTAEQDPELGLKLKAELPGIFAWAVVGLCYLRKRGRFPSSPASEEALREYRVEINNVLEFVQECVSGEPDDYGGPPSVRQDELYRFYNNWCKANGYKPMGLSLFFRRFRSAAPPYKRERLGPRGKRYWLLEGLRLDVQAPMVLL